IFPDILFVLPSTIETLFESLFATYAIFVFGFTAIEEGELPTGRVFIILFVLPSMIVILLEILFIVYTLFIVESTATPLATLSSVILKPLTKISIVISITVLFVLSLSSISDTVSERVLVM